jgi:hypothetical protein
VRFATDSRTEWRRVIFVLPPCLANVTVISASSGQSELTPVVRRRHEVAFLIRKGIGEDDPLRLDDFANDAFGPHVAAVGQSTGTRGRGGTRYLGLWPVAGARSRAYFGQPFGAPTMITLMPFHTAGPGLALLRKLDSATACSGFTTAWNGWGALEVMWPGLAA